MQPGMRRVLLASVARGQRSRLRPQHRRLAHGDPRHEHRVHGRTGGGARGLPRRGAARGFAAAHLPARRAPTAGAWRRPDARVRYVWDGAMGSLAELGGAATCQAVGIGSLAEWRQTRAEDTGLPQGAGLPREVARYRVVFRDSDVILARGHFPLTRHLGWVGAADAIAVMRNTPACQRGPGGGGHREPRVLPGRRARARPRREGPLVRRRGAAAAARPGCAEPHALAAVVRIGPCPSPSPAPACAARCASASRRPTLFCAHCHCSMCRRNHGAAFVTWFGIARERLALEAGEDVLVRHALLRARHALLLRALRQLAVLRVDAPSRSRGRRARQPGRPDRSRARDARVFRFGCRLDRRARRAAAPRRQLRRRAAARPRSPSRGPASGSGTWRSAFPTSRRPAPSSPRSACASSSAEPDFGLYELRGGTHLRCFPATPPAPGALAPFDLMVDDLDASHARFGAAGLAPSPITKSRFHRAFTLAAPSGHVVAVQSSHALRSSPCDSLRPRASGPEASRDHRLSPERVALAAHPLAARGARRALRDRALRSAIRPRGARRPSWPRCTRSASRP